MMKRLPLLLALLAGCGKESSGSSDGLSNRPLKAEHQALVARFADAVVRKDYKGAFAETASDYQSEVGWDEFQASISRYRDRAESAPTYKIKATEDDPSKIKEDSVVALFVPEAKRGRIVEEAAIHFHVKGKGGDDADGFWALICWIVDESGTWKILNYYQDD